MSTVLWYDPHSTATRDFFMYRRAIMPGAAIPGKEGIDWGFVRSEVTSYVRLGYSVLGLHLWADDAGRRGVESGGTGYDAELTAPWACAYCGGLRAASAHRCDGCGASRSQV